ncbi:MAG TPA: MobF family relaxase [Rhodocyclaceae bacterium]|jgi:conjugative relaxase-like TrwC/TraI family protein
MLSVKRIMDGGYIEDSVKRTEEYVSEGKEPPGEYFGKGAAALGLSGKLKKGELSDLLKGLHPKTGEKIFEVDDASVIGFDKTFSASKSVSILAAVADKKTRDEIHLAFRQSVDAAMAKFEDETRVRLGRGDWQPCQGIIAVGYEHMDSRELDPQLHEHYYLVARGLNADGKFVGMDTRDPYVMQKNLGAMFRAEFAGRLREMGFVIEPGVSDTFEIAGVPEGLKELFSQRSSQIADFIERRVDGYKGKEVGRLMAQGLDRNAAEEKSAADVEAFRKGLLKSPKARQAAAYATRKAKDVSEHGESREAQMKRWQDTAKKEFGFGASAVRKLKKMEPPEPEPFDMQAVLERALAGNSVFKMRDLETALLVEKQFHPEIDIKETMREMMDRNAKTPLLFLKDKHGEHWLTSAELRRKEEVLVARAENSVRQGTSHAVPKGIADRVIAEEEARMRAEYGSKFKEAAWQDQQAAIRKVLESGNIALTVGRAGTGKTTTFSVARKVYEAAGYNLKGTSQGTIAAEGLGREAGIESMNVAQWKAQWSKGKSGGIDDRTIFVVDEAALVGTDDMREIITTVGMYGGKVVLLGDHGQLQNISSGQVFERIADKLGDTVATLDTVTRQKDADFRDAVSGLREGDAEAAVDFLDAKGWITTTKDRDAAMAAMVKDWSEDPADITKKLMMAGKNDDAHAINQAAHDALRDAGEIGEEHFVSTKIGENESRITTLSVGDRILFRKNDREIGVKNGNFGRVTGIDMKRDGSHSLTVMLADDKGKDTKEVRFSTEDYRAFQHGYCITTFSSQGKTVEAAYSFVDRTMTSRESAYVQVSRATDRGRLYMTEDERKDIVNLLSRSNRKETTLAYDLLDGGETYQDEAVAHYGDPKTVREAVARKDANAIRRLAEDGKDLEGREGRAQNTALHLAVRDGNAEAVKALLECGASCDPRNAMGITPLHDAAKAGNRDIAELLLAAGADPLAVARNGDTPFLLARRGPSPVSDLLAAAAITDSHERVPPLPLNEQQDLPRKVQEATTDADIVYEQPEPVVAETHEIDLTGAPTPPSADFEPKDDVHQQPALTGAPTPEAEPQATAAATFEEPVTFAGMQETTFPVAPTVTEQKKATIEDQIRKTVSRFKAKGPDDAKAFEMLKNLAIDSKGKERRNGAIEKVFLEAKREGNHPLADAVRGFCHGSIKPYGYQKTLQEEIDVDRKRQHEQDRLEAVKETGRSLVGHLMSAGGALFDITKSGIASAKEAWDEAHAPAPVIDDVDKFVKDFAGYCNDPMTSKEEYVLLVEKAKSHDERSPDDMVLDRMLVASEKIGDDENSRRLREAGADPDNRNTPEGKGQSANDIAEAARLEEARREQEARARKEEQERHNREREAAMTARKERQRGMSPNSKGKDMER